ncbi:hypothetical protein AT977_00230 [Streptococcus pneumoniae]|nr:hypothetical protein AT977_00230 [Streptococcus pneumoniae]
MVNRINNASLASTVFIDLAFWDVLLYSVWLYKLYSRQDIFVGKVSFLPLINNLKFSEVSCTIFVNSFLNYSIA